MCYFVTFHVKMHKVSPDWFKLVIDLSSTIIVISKLNGHFLFELFWSNVKCNGKSLSFLFVIGLIISDLLQVAIVNKIKQFFKTQKFDKKRTAILKIMINNLICYCMPTAQEQGRPQELYFSFYLFKIIFQSVQGFEDGQ